MASEIVLGSDPARCFSLAPTTWRVFASPLGRKQKYAVAAVLKIGWLIGLRV
jgi:hypothetical protein